MPPNDLETARLLDAAIIGVVTVRHFEQLAFDELDVQGSRALSTSKINQLIHRFDHEDCRRLDPLTWIACEVSVSNLQRVTSAEWVRALTRAEPKEMIFSKECILHCFQGQHRLTAAVQWLSPDDLWWNFVLYDSEKLTSDCQKKLRESENGHQDFSDGEIFRNVRHYQRREENEAAREWLAKWSPTKCHAFNQIFVLRQDKNDHNRQLRESLDALLPFAALWPAWLMGTHLPSLKCPEV
jgi:hypothetical protein